MTEEQGFWKFSGDVYDRARESCLNLQDHFGFDVNLLLFCCWRGTMGATLEEAELIRIMDGIGAWRANVVEPLRTTRRWLTKTDFPDGAQDLRRRVLEVELQGERVLQGLIIAAAEPCSRQEPPNRDIGVQTARRNLEIYQRVAIPDAPADAAPFFLELLEGVFASGADQVIVAADGPRDGRA